MNVLITDIDEVVLQWRPSFIRYLDDRNIPHDRSDKAKRFDELLGPDVWKLITDFNTNYDLFSVLPAYRDADQILPLFKDRGWKVIGLTAAGTHPTTIAARKENLNTLFPGIFDAIHHVDYQDGKGKWLKHYPKGLFVDDVWHHIETAIPHHTCFHMPRVWDREMRHDDVHRVEDWWDVWRITFRELGY